VNDFLNAKEYMKVLLSKGFGWSKD